MLFRSEDTRHSHSLLRAYGIENPASSWLALHEHNEQQAAQEVIVRLQSGQRIIYLCDAGTPGLSDPGARLVAAVQARGLRVSPIPGASSATALLSVSGDTERSDWVFTGFCPPKARLAKPQCTPLPMTRALICFWSRPTGWTHWLSWFKSWAIAR